MALPASDAVKAQEDITTTTAELPKTVSVDGIDDDNTNDHHTKLGSTRNDKQDMSRMGKVQVLRRTYRPLSTLSFTVLVQATWEFLLVTNVQALVNGGLAGFFWSYLWTYCGMGVVNLSLAEMASMAPTSGGQYHWVSEFAPPQYQRFASHIIGWMSTLSWQAGNASGPFLIGTLIQALAGLSYPEYEPTRWQGTLMSWAVIALVWIINVYGSRAMPIFQNVMLLLHVFGFFTFIIIFWVLSPRNSAEVVFTEFVNDGGWSSMGLSLMVGQVSAIYALICSDCAAHMAEETKDAGRTVPLSILRSYVLNGATGLVFLISFLFALTSVGDALEDPSTYTAIWVFRQAVSTPGVIGLTSVLIVLLFASSLSYNLSTSRQSWAFARDQGLPFHSWIAKVDPKLHVPVNSITVTCLFSAALALINVGSETALNAMISLNLVSLMMTYFISIGLLIYRRVYHPQLLPPARWSLGRWSTPVNIAGFLYSIHAFFWSFWPETSEVDTETFNWAVVMFVGAGLLCVVDYFVRGRKSYKGPVVLVQGWRTD